MKEEKDVLIPLGSDHLNEYNNEEQRRINIEAAEQRKNIINKTLENLGVNAKVKDYVIGPNVTRYNLELANNNSIKPIVNAIPNIQDCLGGLFVRFESDNAEEFSPGLEVENAATETVSFKELYESLPDVKDHLLAVPLGKRVNDKSMWLDLNDTPHILISGTTGSGKSIFINNLITTLMMRNTPDQVRFVLFDPKHVELNRYRDEPHLLCPIVKDADTALNVLNKLCEEMEERYRTFEEHYCCNVIEYNELAEEQGLTKLPYIIVVIDEYADLVDMKHSINNPVILLAQKARAAGIHLVIATQRPSTKVIIGALKANMPTRIAFMTSNMVDSVTLLGEPGAERLLGRGDMFVQSPTVARLGLIRLQGSLIKRNEIMFVVDFCKEYFKTEYDQKFLGDEKPQTEEAIEKVIDPEEERYLEIRSWVMMTDYISISRIQRECTMGFNRATRFFLRLQQEGIVDTKPTKRGYAVIKKSS